MPAFPPPTPLASTLSFAAEGWAWTALAFLAGGALVLLLSYRSSPLRGGVKWLALGLKGTGLLLLALALMEPVRVDETPRRHSNDLVLLADNSASLSVPLAPGAQPPGETLRGALGAGGDSDPAWMESLGEVFRLQPYVFDLGARHAADFDGLEFSRPHSTLVAALDAIRTRFANRPLAAVVAFTDGNATDAAALEEFLTGAEERGGLPPVFPVVVGEDPEGVRDLAVARAAASTTPFEDAPVTIEVEARVRGEFPDPVEVYAMDSAGEVLASETFAAPVGEGESALPVRLRLGAFAPGISQVTVGIRQTAEPPLPEITDANNRYLVAVDQGAGPYRILYAGGRPNWEYKFLRRSLAGDAELDLAALIRIANREPRFEWRGRPGETSNPLFKGFRRDLPEEIHRYDEPVFLRLNTATADELRDGFPKEAETLFPRFRAVVLDAMEASFFTVDQMELLEQFVSLRGGTVVMLGSQESFQHGGWDGTAVGRMLPVHLDRAAEGPPVLDATFDLAREGWLEPWMRLRGGTEEERIRIAHMPPFHAVNRVGSVKPGASVLATVTDQEGRVLPAVVTQRYGEGRTAAVTIGDLWRWGMVDPEQRAEMERSWRQLMRWAVGEAPGRVQLSLDHADPGGLPLTRLAVRVRDEAFQPQDDATVIFTATDPGGRAVPLSADPSLEEPGLFTAEHAGGESGGYLYSARVLDEAGVEIGAEVAARTFNPEAEEFSRLGPDTAFLERIAAATGGEVLALDETGRLPGLLSGLDVPVLERRQRPLWHAPWIFLLALACFLGEWGLRRLRGIL